MQFYAIGLFLIAHHEMQDIFFFMKQAIDAYFAGGVFSVTVVGGCCAGRRPAAAP